MLFLKFFRRNEEGLPLFLFLSNTTNFFRISALTRGRRSIHLFVLFCFPNVDSGIRMMIGTNNSTNISSIALSPFSNLVIMLSPNFAFNEMLSKITRQNGVSTISSSPAKSMIFLMVGRSLYQMFVI